MVLHPYSLEAGARPTTLSTEKVPRYLCTCSQAKLIQAPGPQASPFSLKPRGRRINCFSTSNIDERRVHSIISNCQMTRTYHDSRMYHYGRMSIVYRCFTFLSSTLLSSTLAYAPLYSINSDRPKQPYVPTPYNHLLMEFNC